MEIAFLGIALVTWWGSQFLLGLETITYPGFVQSHANIEVTWLVIILVAVFFIVSQLPFIKGKQRIINQILILQLVASIIFVLLSILGRFLDETFYDNFFFAKTHIHLLALERQVYFSILILVIVFITQSVEKLPHLKKLKKRVRLKSWVEIAFIIMMLTFCLHQLLTTFSGLLGQIGSIVRNAQTTYFERKMLAYGGKDSAGWIYPYTEFINRHVPVDGIIFIPPQMESWEMEGNPYFLRWFIYPRNTIHSKTIYDQIPADAEYVLIAWGSWKFSAKEFGWPRITIPKEQIETIVFIDRTTGLETSINNADFIPQSFEQWGIIKLRK